MHKKIFISIVIFLLGLILIKTAKLYPLLIKVFFTQEIDLKKNNDNINILLLGIGGGIHEGPNLTDTIIFSNISLKNNRVTLFSIPRDLWIPDLGAKINIAYAQGEEKNKGGGLILSRAVVSKVLNQEVDYIIRIDFSGFIKAINVVGGIDIDTPNVLDDYNYPIEGQEDNLCGHTDTELKDFRATSSAEQDLWAFLPCRYKHLHVDAGLQHMDGQTALEFVRSRHAEGEEGSDFARSRRQALVIKAIKDKVFSLNLILNPSKIIGLYNTLQKSIDTNIKLEEIDDFIHLAQKIQKTSVNNFVLDYGDEKTGRSGLLINPPLSADFNYAWILVPRVGNGNFSEVQNYTACLIKSGDCFVSKKPIN